MSEIEAKLERLSANIRALPSALICYSGGVDSAFVLAVATRQLGERAIGMTAVSPSLPPGELDYAKALAAEIGAVHRLVQSQEMDDPRYVANNADRCFYCKSELYEIAEAKRKEWGLAVTLNGTNCNDLGDYRPGLVAAQNAGVKSPLVECEFRRPTSARPRRPSGSARGTSRPSPAFRVASLTALRSPPNVYRKSVVSRPI